ncbi:hypothetical protein [Longispora albida]|uniref:hypothetical protein n=1 Tax=Longispora albida TaxID=203523 RepID=UPI0003737759|nr:hypothetical protein [Longispora albida]
MIPGEAASPALSRVRPADLAFLILPAAVTVAIRAAEPPPGQQSEREFWVFSALGLVLMAIPWGLLYFHAVRHKGKPRPAAFTVRGGTFTAPYQLSNHLGIVGAMLALIAATFRWDSPSISIGVLPFVGLVLAVRFALAAAGPAVVLRPDHIEFRAFLRHRVAWDDIAGVFVHESVRIRTVTGKTRRTLQHLAIVPEFLADAIGYYAAHAEHRPEIGTEAGHQRLRWYLTTYRATLAGHQGPGWPGPGATGPAGDGGGGMELGGGGIGRGGPGGGG